eukprot:TRINITY_DN4290_c0_g3_i1.p1 TRINITY_DN4290_c0_g3~~TRINITY_DN4290_c0_g3_i1.p1  ORF type:complete len:305 (-),score=56.60 TRINITY_DN4290_c0_g3_i1:214-1083(-)
MQAQQSMQGASPAVAAPPPVSSRAQASAEPTSGFKIAASITTLLFGCALFAFMISPRSRGADQTTAGVHYMPMRPMTYPVAETQPEQVMTNEPGSMHYLVSQRVFGPTPTLAPMTAGYTAFTQVAQQEVHFVKWLVAVDDIVQIGDPLLVFSRNGRREELKASAAGQIKELAHVSEKDRLSTGTKLVIVGHPRPALESAIVSFAIALLGLLLFVAVIAHGRSLPAYEQLASQDKSLEEGLAPKAEKFAAEALPLKVKEQEPAAASGLPRVMRAAADTLRAQTDAEDPKT